MNHFFRIALLLLLLGQQHLFAQNLLISNGNNPDFENNNSGFKSQLNYINSPNGNGQPGEYSVTTDPKLMNTANYSLGGDHTTGSGKMMVVDGSDNKVFWEQSPNIPLKAGTTYIFSYWIKNVNSTHPDKPTIKFNPVDQCNCPPTLVSGSATVTSSDWVEVKYEFTPTGTGDRWTRIELSTVSAGLGGHDFAIDDLSLTEKVSCVPEIISYQVDEDFVVCDNNSTTINVVTNGTGTWIKRPGTPAQVIIKNPTSKTTEVSNLNYLTNNVFEWIPDLNSCQTGNKIDEILTVVARKKPTLTIKSVGGINCFESVVDIDVQGPSAGLYKYKWDTTDGNIVSGQGTSKITVNKPGNYVLSVFFDNVGTITVDCPTSLPVKVDFVGTTPIARITGPTVLTCLNDPIELDGSTSDDGTFSWTNSSGVEVATTPKIPVNQPDTYTLVVTKGICVSLPVPYVVTENKQKPTVVVNKSSDIDCANPTITLSGNGSETDGVLTYSWLTTDGNISGIVDQLNVTADAAGTYTLTVINLATQCSDSKTVTVSASTGKPVVNITKSNDLTCKTSEDKVTLNASASTPAPSATVTYVWKDASGTVIGSGNASQIQVSQAGTYSLEITDSANGCSTPGTIQVNDTRSNVTVSITVPGKISCTDKKLTLTSNVTNAGSNPTYLWTPSLGGSILSGQGTANIEVSNAGTYTLLVTNTANQCTGTNVVQVEGDDTFPQIVFNTPDVLDCSGDPVLLDAQASTNGDVFEWTFNGNVVGTFPTLQASQPGVYTLKLLNSTSNCEASKPITVQQDITPPTVNIAVPQDITCTRRTVTLDGSLSSGGNSMIYLWTASNGGVIDSGADTRTPVVSSGGRYTLTITNTATGCPSSDFVDVQDNSIDLNISDDSYALCNTLNQFDVSTFKLSDKDSAFTGGSSILSVKYYLTSAQAEDPLSAGATLNKTSYTNVTNPQTVYARVEDSQGCYDIAELELVVNNGPVLNTTPTPLEYCDPNSDGIGEFTPSLAEADILQGLTGVTLTYHETRADAEAGLKAVGTIYTNRQPYNTRLYVRGVSANGCPTIVELPLVVKNTPRATIPESYPLCDDDTEPNVESFDLTNKNKEILGSLSASAHNITYHLTEAEANSGSNPILSETNYRNTTNPQEIWARVTHIASGCSKAVPLTLEVNTVPQLDVPTLYVKCDENAPGNLREEFDLTYKNQEIINNPSEFNFTYHLTKSDAEGKLRAIANPRIYTNSSNSGARESIHVRVENPKTGCYNTTILDIRVDPLPSPKVPKPLPVCDPDADGFTEFDLASLTQEIQDGDTNLTITYHETEPNAKLGISALTSPYSNIQNASKGITIYARAHYNTLDNPDGCSKVIPISLIAPPKPQVPLEELDPIKVCDDQEVDGSTNNDGFAIFDITRYENQIYGTQSKTQHSISYHHSKTDAELEQRAITTPKTHRNQTAGKETIWAALKNNTTECINTIKIELEVSPTPVIFVPKDLELCDDEIADEKTSFDLTLRNDEITNNNDAKSYTIRYYEVESDALARNTKYIADPIRYINKSNPQPIFVMVSDKDSECYQKTKLTLRVVPRPTPEKLPEPLTRCDSNNTGDGIETFDLEKNSISMANGETVTFTYYATEAEAKLGQNPIANPTAYENTQRDEQTIYAVATHTVATSIGTICNSLPVPIKLIVAPLPEPNSLPIFEACAINTTTSYPFEMSKHTPKILKDMINPTDYQVRYYISEAAAESATPGTQLNTPFFNTSNPQTVWARIEHVTEKCHVSGSFDLVVKEESVVTIPTQPLPGCSNQEDNSLITSFVLTDIEDVILKDLTATDYTVNYYESYNVNTEVLSNPIADPTAYTNTRNNQRVYAEVVRNDGTTCSKVVDFTLRVSPRPVPVLDEKYIICLNPETGQVIPGEELELNSGLLEATHTFEWLKDGNVIPDADKGKYTVTEPGVYGVIATNKSTQCSNDPVVPTTVVASSAPVLVYAQSISGTFGSNHTIEIVVSGDGDYQYSIDGGKTFQDENIFQNQPPGIYDYAVEDKNGCVKPLDGKVFAADYMRFFTPNGDGMNDEWNIIGLSEEAKARILIFDRYGKLLKEIRPEGKGWDGTFNGYSLPANDYWFVVEYEENGQQKEFKSHFTLKR